MAYRLNINIALDPVFYRIQSAVFRTFVPTYEDAKLTIETDPLFELADITPVQAGLGRGIRLWGKVQKL